MQEREKDVAGMFDEFMKGFEPQYVSNNWPIENGLYKQYSAFETVTTSVGATGYSF